MKKFLLPILSILFIFTSCSSLKVTADYDGSIDFTKYKTYSYLGWNENSNKIINDFDRKRVEAAFGSEFNSRGLEFVLAGGDIEVSLFLVTEQKTATQAYTDYYRPYGGYYYGHAWGWGGGYANTTYHQYDYTEGSLVCDVFDAAEKKLIWQSVGSGTMNDKPTSQSIIKSVKKIMSLYPITPNK
ncbi:MAG: DUF4136 domain-containing protein [Bacteroidales bacterium]|nr:DUF4136 domain-containing protein [Bacteroidales bacterium]